MKIINADWEIRNLGVSTVELTIDVNDTIYDVVTTIQNINTEYLVVKLPSLRSDLIWQMQKAGLVYVEDMVRLQSELSELTYPPLIQRMRKSVTCQPIEQQDFDIIIREVENGLFDSDRIFLDPFFSDKSAARRYALWLMDEKSRGTLFYKYIYKDRMVGFFTVREMEKGVYISALGGIFKDFRKGGIGSIVKVPDVVKDLGGKKLIGDVSSNNVSQIKNLVYNGYVPQSINHIYVKHMSNQ